MKYDKQKWYISEWDKKKGYVSIINKDTGKEKKLSMNWITKKLLEFEYKRGQADARRSIRKTLGLS